MSRLLSIAWKELLQLRRDRMTLGMMLALPVVQLLLFGYAINTDVRHLTTVVWDQDGSAASRDLARSLEQTTSYDLLGEVKGYEEIERSFRTGSARVALVVPPGHAAALAQGRPAPVQLLIDGSDPQTVAGASGTAASLSAARQPPAGGLVVEPAILYNPDQRTAVVLDRRDTDARYLIWS